MPQENPQDAAEHWEQEVKALRMMNELNHEHIVRFITAFRRLRKNGEEEHYVMFEWANGGNLRDMWERVPFPPLTGSLVKDVVKQICGLASALQAAHNLNNTEASYRHGDLKPENILIFKTGDEMLGTLKIGDWGEAKYHGKDQITEMRSKKTTARYATRRYQAPEVVTGIKGKRQNQPVKRRSRLYDIWAMGCITLEFVVWLLYGLDGLKKFHQDVDGDTFYQISIENGKKVARVHDAAVRWMDHMEKEPACKVGSTAIGNLLELVKGALLVVKLPRRLGTGFPKGSSLPAIVETTEAAEATEAEKTRADSFLGDDSGQTARSDLSRAMNHLSLSDASPIANLPRFTLTTPESDALQEPAQHQDPVQPEPEVPGPERCLASAFSVRMDDIWSEDDIVGYWDTHKDRLRVPLGLASPSSLQVTERQEGHPTEDQAVSDRYPLTVSNQSVLSFSEL